ncbi:MAG: HPt (histidine-containing phosphotransfer) domain-containing protein [Litorivivens sp.]|jgi:HPt (histidine-containing phosphotransfer) domain-containing protein
MDTHNHEQLFDLSYLNQIFQGNQEMINSIIQLFLEQVPEYIKEMQDCVDRNDLLSLHPLAHKAKSSVAMLGLKSMEGNIVQIEQDSKHNENLDGLPLLVGNVRSECDVVYSQLRLVLTGAA